jgi:hypothetical protein
MAKPPTFSGKLQIFISHVSSEAGLAAILKDGVKKYFPNQTEVFVSSDVDSVRIGSDFLKTIKNTLNKSIALLVLCSPESIYRPWVNFEIGAAWNRNIPIAPICHSGLRPADLPIPLNQLQGAEASTREGLLKIFNFIAEHLERPVPKINFNRIITKVKEFETTCRRSIAQNRWLGDVAKDDPGNRLIGKWDSTWIIEEDGKEVEQYEEMEIERVRGNRLYGVVRSKNKDSSYCVCNLQGILNDRYLQIFWTAPEEAATEDRFLTEYGCYFLERQSDGNYLGYATGFFWHINKVGTYRQTVTRSGYRNRTGERPPP